MDVCLQAEDFLATFQGEQFDVILAAEVLKHMGALEVVFRRSLFLLAPGGLLAFSIDIFHGVPLEGGEESVPAAVSSVPGHQGSGGSRGDLSGKKVDSTLESVVTIEETTGSGQPPAPSTSPPRGTSRSGQEDSSSEEGEDVSSGDGNSNADSGNADSGNADSGNADSGSGGGSGGGSQRGKRGKDLTGKKSRPGRRREGKGGKTERQRQQQRDRDQGKERDKDKDKDREREGGEASFFLHPLTNSFVYDLAYLHTLMDEYSLSVLHLEEVDTPASAAYAAYTVATETEQSEDRDRDRDMEARRGGVGGAMKARDDMSRNLPVIHSYIFVLQAGAEQ
jgi:hypothetical protein